MKRSKLYWVKETLFLMSLGAIFFLEQSKFGWSLHPNVEKFVEYETRANAVAVRSNAKVAMPHYEIPLEWITPLISTRVPLDVYKSLVFKKNGIKMIRWVINPEDTKWHLEVETWLKNKIDSCQNKELLAALDNNPLEKKYYFDGYQTASRSYIVEDPNSHAQFSIKGSTNVTGGNWTDKKQELHDANDIINVSKYLTDIQKVAGFENFFLMDEPMALGISELDQAIVVRLLNEMPKNQEVYYLPGFSALHEQVGKEIALKNGATNPEEFWKEHYIIPMGRVLAELAAKTGISYDSPHSQNFVIELDANSKPTGRIGIRDFGDVYLNKPFLKKMHQDKLLEEFSEKSNILSYQNTSFGPLHGNHFPSWTNGNDYENWGNEFYKSFEEAYSKYTGIPEDVLHNNHRTAKSSYFSNTYKQDSPAWAEYFNKIETAALKRHPLACSDIFAHAN